VAPSALYPAAKTPWFKAVPQAVPVTTPDLYNLKAGLSASTATAVGCPATAAYKAVPLFLWMLTYPVFLKAIFEAL